MQFQQRPKIIDLIVFLMMGYVLAGCSSGGNIIADHDHSAPFGTYKTYNFMEGAGPETGTYQSFFSQYMVMAITIEMEKRGYTKSDDPDLLVNFNAILQDKTKVTTTPAPTMGGGYYGYRGGYYGGGYGGWGGYGYATETRVSQYTEGTFNIDLVDARKHQLVWEAVGVGKVTEKKLENLEESVMNGVPKFFSLYPYVAGDPMPVSTEN
jgi:hypothetical protein